MAMTRGYWSKQDAGLHGPTLHKNVIRALRNNVFASMNISCSDVTS